MDRTLARRIGRNIAALRTLRGWSQKGLAARVDVTRGRLSKWEGGEHAPPVEKLMALARELEVGLDDLVSDGSAQPPDGLTPGQRELVRGALRSLSRLLPSGEKRGPERLGRPSEAMVASDL